MGVVLVVEPEASQAEQLLKVLRKRVRAESILVKSTAAAIEAIGHGTPDLILLSTLLSPRDEDSLMAHLRSLEGAAHLQTLTIPQLAVSSRDAEETSVFGRFRKKKKAAPAQAAGCDPKVFAEEIAAHLARAVEIRSQPRTEPMFKPTAVGAPVETAVEPAFEAMAAPAFEEAVEPVFEPMAALAATSEPVSDEVDAPMFSSAEPMFSSAEPMFSSREPMFSSAAVEASDEPDLTLAILASIDAQDSTTAIPEPTAEPVFSSFQLEEAVEPVSASALFEPDDQMDLASALLAAHAEQAPISLAASVAPGRPAAREVQTAKEIDFTSALLEVHGEPAFSPAMFESHAEPDFDFALIESALIESALVESKPQTKKPDTNQKPAVAESNVVAFRPAAAVVPVSEAKVEAAKEAEPDDLLERLARRFGFGSEMFKVAEVDAPSALPSGMASAQRRQEPVAKTAPAVEVKSEPEPEPEPVVQDDSEERMAAQVAAVQAEAEATLAAELERVRAEGEARRLAELARLQGEADRARDAAIAEARAAAEREARDALDAELTRVRSEAEGVFAADLARVRAEVEEKLKAQVGEAETRLAAAERARSAAEAAAAAALGAEVARVRGEAETRLQSELERIRREAEAARAAEQSVAKHATEQIREAAAREAREVAEQAARRTLDTEIARVRAQADTFLETEVSRVRSEAQDRQAAELQELRAQMAEIRETAARTAAEKSGDYYKIWQPRLVPVEKPQPVVETPEPAAPVPVWTVGTYKRWLKWALPTAASVLLIANSGMVINTFASFVAPSPKKEPPPVHAVEPVEPPIAEKVGGALKVDSTPVGAEALVDGKSYGKTPLTIPDLRPGVHMLVLRTGAGSVTRRVTIKAGQTAVSSEAIFAGWLAIFSPIPVDISLNGRRAPVAENGRIMTAPGSYKVDFVNTRFNYHVTETLDVRPGEVTAYTVSIPTAAVHVTAPDGAEISVDGQPAGKAPLADLSIPIGTHAITATHPDRGVRTTTVAVRYDEVNDARFEFDR